MIEIYTKAEDADKLIDVLKEQVGNDPDDLKSRIKLAKLLSGAKKFAEAEEVARDAIRIDVTDAEAQKALLEALDGQKKTTRRRSSRSDAGAVRGSELHGEPVGRKADGVCADATGRYPAASPHSSSHAILAPPSEMLESHGPAPGRRAMTLSELQTLIRDTFGAKDGRRGHRRHLHVVHGGSRRTGRGPPRSVAPRTTPPPSSPTSWPGWRPWRTSPA